MRVEDKERKLIKEMGRVPCCEKMGLKKGPWSSEEDQILISYINQNGHGNWRALPKLAGLVRCGKSCRLRWINYLQPDIKRGNFTKEEDDTIIHLHQLLGNRWAAIAAKLPGRTDNEIKNVWHTRLKKRLFKCESVQVQVGSGNPTISSPQHSTTELSSLTDSSAVARHSIVKHEQIMDLSEGPMFPEIDQSFWSEQLILLTDHQDIKISKIDVDKVQQLSSAKIDDGIMDFRCNLFTGPGELKQLPEF